MKTFAFLMIIAAAPALAEQPPMFQNTSIAFERASDLYDSCAAQRPTCVAYIEGAADVMSASNYVDLCFPRGIRAGQLVELVRNYYIANRPNFSDASAWSLVYSALKEPLQCQPNPAQQHHSGSTSL